MKSSYGSEESSSLLQNVNNNNVPKNGQENAIGTVTKVKRLLPTLLCGTIFGVIATLLSQQNSISSSRTKNSDTFVLHYPPKLDEPLPSLVQGPADDGSSSSTTTTTTTTIGTPTITEHEDGMGTSFSSSSLSQSGTSKVRTRPVCTYYFEPGTAKKTNRPPRIVQTSMEEPSQPWSNIECYPQPFPASINSYGAPDAVLDVQFLHDDRDTTHHTKDETDRSATDTDSSHRPRNPNIHQPILGFGGAFTEAAALNFMTLSDRGQEAALELLFGSTGLGYNMGRFPINSCDFSVESYSFDETVDDFQLSDFDTNVTHDAATMIQFALRAKKVFDAAWGDTLPPTNTSPADDTNGTNEERHDTNLHSTCDGDNRTNSNNSSCQIDHHLPEHQDSYEVFRFFASPWSPPSWMKAPTWEDAVHDPNSSYAERMTYSNQPVCLRDGVGNESKYAAAWGLYFSKFITAYRNHGIDLWAITVQNEPEFPAPWEACSYSPQNESDFVAHHLGPILRRDHPNVKILAFDHNKDHVNNWVQVIHNTTHAALHNYTSARSYVDGTAYHWYAGGMDRLLDGAVGTPNLHRLQEKIRQLGITKNKHHHNHHHIVLGSEACHCPTTGYAGGDINNYWARAERYAHTILADLATGSNGWLEWNFILDSIGGPNHLNNLCDTTILAVPHRAVAISTNLSSPLNHRSHPTSPLPPFEKTKPMSGDGKTIIGDDRTKEELNSYGFPADFINVGIAVQPLFYYTGHITRYVRPGAYSVPGLVNQATIETTSVTNKPSTIGQIFQPLGSAVAGGGLNDLARNGIEITVWPCEGSTRQQFVWDNDLHSKDVTLLKRIQVHGHDWLGNPTTSCFARSNDVDLLGITLTSCTTKTAGIYDIVRVESDKRENNSSDRYYIKLLNPLPSANTKSTAAAAAAEPRQCLTILELGNNGGSYGPRGGAQVALGDCSHESAKWNIDIRNGVASSLYFTPPQSPQSPLTTTNETELPNVINPSLLHEVCMTTGWPFLQMGAFVKHVKPTTTSTTTTTTTNITNNSTTSTTTIDKTVIVLNEGRESANYVLKDYGKIILTGSIPPRSIQTILL